MVQQAADGKEKGPVHVRIGADALDWVRVTLTNFKVPQNTTKASISCPLLRSPLGRHFAPPKVTEAKDKNPLLEELTVTEVKPSGNSEGNHRGGGA